MQSGNHRLERNDRAQPHETGAEEAQSRLRRAPHPSHDSVCCARRRHRYWNRWRTCGDRDSRVDGERGNGSRKKDDDSIGGQERGLEGAEEDKRHDCDNRRGEEHDTDNYRHDNHRRADFDKQCSDDDVGSELK
jgi:hypothetical protein